MSDKEVILPKVNSAKWLSMNNLKNEEWRDVCGFEGYYQVSNYGRVKGLERNVPSIDGRVVHIKPRILFCCLNSHGYYSVNLTMYNKHYSKEVHRMVALAFIPNIDNLEQVNHRDENKTNNCVYNLEWCTRSYNALYGTTQERISQSRKNNPNIGKDVLQFTAKGVFVAEYRSISEASKSVGVDASNITRAIEGYKFLAGGFVWIEKTLNYKQILESKIKILQSCKRKEIAVIQMDLDGTFIQRYKNAEVAARDLGIGGRAIRDCCYGKKKTYKGFRFEYA